MRRYVSKMFHMKQYEEEIKMCWWCIKNSVVIICFTALAVLFNHWWIIFFALLFMSDYKEVTRPKDKDEVANGTDRKDS